MSYNTKNKIRMYAEDTSTTNDEVNGIVYDDATWISSILRKRGAVEGIAKSQDYNTALKQASLMTTTLAEIIAQRFNTDVTTNIDGISFNNFEDYITFLASKFSKENFLQDKEVLKRHLGDDILQGTFDNLTSGNVSKTINKKLITDIFETNGTTVKNSTNSKFSEYASADISKGTIEERLTNLGFKQGSIVINAALPESYYNIIKNTFSRQGNYVIGEFELQAVYLTLKKEYGSYEINLGKLSNDFLYPKSDKYEDDIWLGYYYLMQLSDKVEGILAIKPDGNFVIKLSTLNEGTYRLTTSIKFYIGYEAYPISNKEE